MNIDRDQLDQAFGLLNARSQGRVPINPDLEELVMRDLENADRLKVNRLTKVAAAIVICAAATGAAAAAGGMDAIMDWANLTGYFEVPGMGEGYVEDGRVMSGEVNFNGNTLRIEGGHVVDKDGNALGSMHIESAPAPSCGEETCSQGACSQK